MVQELQAIQLISGAILTELTPGFSVVTSFGNDSEALKAASQGVALLDRSHWGRLQFSGEDKLRFLHNQSTNNFNGLQPGQGCDTVFVTSTARTIDLVTAYLTEETVLVLVSPTRRQFLIDWLDRYIFPMDRVQIKDVTKETATFSLIGPESQPLLEKIIGENLAVNAYGEHQFVKGKNGSFRIAVGNGLAIPGYTLILDADQAVKVWQQLIEAGAVPMGESVWEQLRITQGRPAPDFELTDDYNPLESRLLHTISYEKGCYIGQETIARLNTYKGVKQHLWGLRLNGKAELGSPVKIDDEKVGTLTSFTETEAGAFGLAYIRTKAGGEGLKVQVGTVEAEVVTVPFLSPP